MNVDKLVPKKLHENENSDSITRFKQIIGGLLPWYEIRASVIIGNSFDLNEAYQNANASSGNATKQRYRQYDHLPFDVSRVQFEIFSFCNTDVTLGKLSKNLISEKNKFRYKDRFEALRVVVRRDELACISDDLEKNCYEAIMSYTDGAPDDIADDFVRLTRAILPKSLSDSKEYFSLALDSVSKFGHELTERWYATTSIANRYSESELEDQETAYRFARCAELVGENVAREKYINRNSAINVCASISPSIGVAVLSRWRDRGIGFFNEQLVFLLEMFIKKGLINSQVAFALEALTDNINSVDLVCRCIESAESQHSQKYILDVYVRNLLMEEIGQTTISKIDGLCNRLDLENSDLSDALSFYEDKKNLDVDQNRQELSNYDNAEPSYDYVSIFEGLDLMSVEDLDAAISDFDSIDGRRSVGEFWQQCFKKVGVGGASILLQNIVLAERADSYDMERAIENIPCLLYTSPSPRDRG